MKNLLPILAATALLASCKSEPADNPAESNAYPDTTLNQVTATAQTESVSANPNADAAADPAIWFNESDPANSLILGSDKTLGFDVFNLDGTRITTDSVGRINNVDVRNNYSFNGVDIALAGGSNRDNVGMDFWRIHPDSLSLEYLTPGSIASDLPDVYRFCLYKSPADNSVYAFVNSKTGKVEQWLLGSEGDSLTATKVRALQLPSQVEGMVTDDHPGNLFVGVENEGIYHFGAEPNDPIQGSYPELSGEDNSAIQYDVEGLTIYYLNDSKGYLIASSQGNNTYAVFDRSGNFNYLGSFEVVDGAIDGTQETDGIDVSSQALGDLYPKGVFVVQDGENRENGSVQAQNFKMIRWDHIAQSFEPALKVK